MLIGIRALDLGGWRGACQHFTCRSDHSSTNDCCKSPARLSANESFSGNLWPSSASSQGTPCLGAGLLGVYCLGKAPGRQHVGMRTPIWGKENRPCIMVSE